MPAPHGFSWVEKPKLAALARPSSAEELAWMREQGIQVIVSVSEHPLRRAWVNDAGLMVVHEQVEDMTAPTQEQLDRCVATIERANEQGMGVAVHCTAGLGRTGTVLAAYYVARGMPAKGAIAKVKKLRPGSIETDEQEQAVEEFASRRGAAGERGASAP